MRTLALQFIALTFLVARGIHPLRELIIPERLEVELVDHPINHSKRPLDCVRIARRRRVR